MSESLFYPSLAQRKFLHIHWFNKILWMEIEFCMKGDKLRVANKVKQSRYRPGVAQSVPVVSLTHRPHLPSGNPPGTHFCQRLSRPQGHSAIGRIMSLKNSNDTIQDRTSDLPICSTAPQPLCHRGTPANKNDDYYNYDDKVTLTLWHWNWTFKQQHIIYVKCEYFTNQNVTL